MSLGFYFINIVFFFLTSRGSSFCVVLSQAEEVLPKCVHLIVRYIRWTVLLQGGEKEVNAARNKDDCWSRLARAAGLEMIKYQFVWIEIL